MTKRTAIKLLAGVFGGMFASRGQDLTVGTVAWNGVLATMHWGDHKIPYESRMKARKDYDDCIKIQNSEPGVTKTVYCKQPDLNDDPLVPGTAMLTLNLDGWKGFTVTLGKETRFISRQELWDALKEKP